MFHKEQVQIFQEPNFDSFQLDMNFKHVASETDHEVIWGQYNNQSRMSMYTINI
jgi:hypothetical protein